jgi:hypothetical protein
VLAPNAGTCVYELERAPLEQASASMVTFAACAARARTCTDVLTCASGNHGPTYCATHPSSSCDGTALVSCPPSNTPGWAIDPPPLDCASIGMMCVGDTCSDGNTCNGPLVLYCKGSHIMSCDLFRKAEQSVDCAAVYPGGTCGVADSQLQCVPATPDTCTTKTAGVPYACSGNSLLGCYRLLPSKLDCGPIDSTCGPSGLGFDCVPHAQDCTSKSPDRCNGAALSICVDGRYRDVDCASLGLGACRTTKDGVACGPPGS